MFSFFLCVCVVTVVCLTIETKQIERKRQYVVRHFNYRGGGGGGVGRPPPIEKSTRPRLIPPQKKKNQPPSHPSPPKNRTLPSVVNPNRKNEKSGLIDSAHDPLNGSGIFSSQLVSLSLTSPIHNRQDQRDNLHETIAYFRYGHRSVIHPGCQFCSSHPPTLSCLWQLYLCHMRCHFTKV